MASNVQLIQTSLTGDYLTYLNTITVHGSSSSGSNFHLYNSGTSQRIQVINDADTKLRVHNDALSTTSGDHDAYTSPSGLTTGVKVYILDTDGDKWYLRVRDSSVDVISQSLVDNIENGSNGMEKQQLQFDLVTVSV